MFFPRKRSWSWSCMSFDPSCSCVHTLGNYQPQLTAFPNWIGGAKQQNQSKLEVILMWKALRIFEEGMRACWGLTFYYTSPSHYICPLPRNVDVLLAPAGIPVCGGLFLQLSSPLLGSIFFPQEAIPLPLADHHDFIDSWKSLGPACLTYGLCLLWYLLKFTLFK